MTWWRHQMGIFSALLALCDGIHRSHLDSPHEGQWRRALMFSLICTWTNGQANNRETGNLRRHRAHYDASLMYEENISTRYTSVPNACQHSHSFAQWTRKKPWTHLSMNRLCSLWVLQRGLIPAWISNHIPCIFLSHPKFQRLHRWSLGMDM